MAIKKRRNLPKGKVARKRIKPKALSPYNRLQRNALRVGDAISAHLALSCLRISPRLRGSPYLGSSEAPSAPYTGLLHTITGAPSAISVNCYACKGGGKPIKQARKQVKECMDTECPLWPYRLGTDPFFNTKN